MKNLSSRAAFICQRIEQLATISEDPNCLTRLYGTIAFIQAGLQIKEWMDEAGLVTEIDAVGNVRGTLAGNGEKKKVLVIGSHFDTIVNAGKYDGNLGLLLAIDVARKLQISNRKLPFDLEVVGLADEEGVRFNTAYLGSSLLTGTFQEDWLNLVDKQGFTLREVMEQFKSLETDYSDISLTGRELLGFFEAHIEQGPVLQEKGLPISIVSSIAGQARIQAQFTGRAGHAGTTPMNMRRDALCAAAEFIQEVEKFARDNQGRLVATVGFISNKPNVSNVIPGHVSCSLDLRSGEISNINSGLKHLEKLAQSIGQKREVKCKWKLLQINPPVQCDPHFNELLKKAIKGIPLDPVLELVSGAGHDAVIFSKVCPVAMLFIRCRDGISHHPDEYVSSEDIEYAIAAYDAFLDELISFYEKH